MREIKTLVESDPHKVSSQYVVTIGQIYEILFEKKFIKPYEKHILYKIVHILIGKHNTKDSGTTSGSVQQYDMYDDALFGDILSNDRDKKVALYSFITVCYLS